MGDNMRKNRSHKIGGRHDQVKNLNGHNPFGSTLQTFNKLDDKDVGKSLQPAKKLVRPRTMTRSTTTFDLAASSRGSPDRFSIFLRKPVADGDFDAQRKYDDDQHPSPPREHPQHTVIEKKHYSLGGAVNNATGAEDLIDRELRIQMEAIAASEAERMAKRPRPSKLTPARNEVPFDPLRPSDRYRPPRNAYNERRDYRDDDSGSGGAVENSGGNSGKGSSRSPSQRDEHGSADELEAVMDHPAAVTASKETTRTTRRT